MTSTDSRRAVLGAFIRAHWERLPSPAQSRGRRRTPGWRREELADAAGIGVTWLTWLEQGRDVNASPAALARLAKTLQLNAAERASLFDLAERRDPDPSPELASTLPSALLDLPAQIAVPAYLLDAHWTARAWNAAAATLFVGWLDAQTIDRNLLRYMFMSDRAPRLIQDWPERAQRLVAEFRADFHRRPGDGAMQALVEALLAASPVFATHWNAQDVRYREGGERAFQHPERGALRYHQTTLLVPTHPGLKLVCLSETVPAEGLESAASLRGEVTAGLL